MHLLEAWTSLGPFHLARLLALPGTILVATLLPGRQLARGSALVGAAGVLLLSEMAVPWWVRGAWGVLWLAIAWQSGRPARPDLPPPPRARLGTRVGPRRAGRSGPPDRPHLRPPARPRLGTRGCRRRAAALRDGGAVVGARGVGGAVARDRLAIGAARAARPPAAAAAI